ncbi:MAG: o-succinylbenzoate synthase [Paraprevotella sp.]|nr:o-succinylbenzoate synthase [Paraprevotella sp.]
METLNIEIFPRTFHFKKPAGTSRGTYTERRSWYVRVTSAGEPGKQGWGECAPLPQLSCDDLPDYGQVLRMVCDDVVRLGNLDKDRWRAYPSMVFGLETALRHWELGTYALWDTHFSRGEEGICINGLIWMGYYASMYAQIRTKLDAGYRCVKLKIGAIGFDEELELLRFIRRHFSASDVELRVDANGAFAPGEAMEKLGQLAELDLHSIEQPIRAGQWEEMARLTSTTPIPIAFDEELIGHCAAEEKINLLDVLRPQYIVLKPSLHGGFDGCREWIEEAEKRGIGWWITSALESNVGLNAIAQWCATWRPSLPQGLGTGLLFTDNVPMPLEIRKDALWYVADRH